MLELKSASPDIFNFIPADFAGLSAALDSLVVPGGSAVLRFLVSGVDLFLSDPGSRIRKLFFAGAR